ncbi:pyruvate dehydrogenase kinase, isozyme 3 [Platysternon megacephalum]|uniref:Pyruvate dehydrogenase kinase, isozyme 3 n=1 Tax=Platysternon megacephalum TaxID=55544 RepID=A0A4D9EHD8_9SAUR|nr:pyruvate dehydrogenase kinase, isozyme 3 [Platysternon megacephalum]
MTSHRASGKESCSVSSDGAGACRPKLPRQHKPRCPSLSQAILTAVANSEPPVPLATIQEALEAGGYAMATGRNKRRFKKVLARLVARQLLRKVTGTQASGAAKATKGKGKGRQEDEGASRKGEKATEETLSMVCFGKRKKAAKIWSSPVGSHGRGEAPSSPGGSRAQ